MSKRCNKNETGISEQSVKLVEEQYENTCVLLERSVSKLGKSLQYQKSDSN